MTATGHLQPEDAAAFARRNGPLSPADRLAISDHAAACAGCRALLADAHADAPPPDLTRVFTRLIHAGTQPENLVPEAWTGAEEFTSDALPALTSAERENLRTFRAHLDQFESEQIVPGGTLGPAKAAAGRETPAGRAASTTPSRWYRLLSWQSLTLAGAMAAVVLVMAVALSHPRNLARGPVAMQTPTSPTELKDGPVQVSADGTLEGLAAIPADLREAVVETIRRGAAPGALLGKLTRGGSPGTPVSPGDSTLTDPTTAVPLSPVGTSVETDQPTFRWKSPAAPTAVEIVVRPSAGGEEIRSVPLAAGSTEWVPPVPLPRGALYRWQVIPVSANGQETNSSSAAKPGTVFKVISADTHAQLEILRAGSSGRSHLTLGVAYAREGLREESAREFHALEESNARSTLARRLVTSLEGRGGS